MKEIWKDIKGYEGLYKISSLGRVWSCRSNKELKQKQSKYGYMKVNLCVDKINKTYNVHRLVAESFIPNPNNLPQVNHRNEDKTCNIVDNLEFCSAKYNSNFGTHKDKLRIASTGRKMPKYGIEKAAEKHKKRIGMFKDGVFVNEYNSAADASRDNENYNYVSISACCCGRLKTYRGYEWKFIKNK